eukprot:1157225-Pelagomonas_calceolata.AAC.6
MRSASQVRLHPSVGTAQHSPDVEGDSASPTSSMAAAENLLAQLASASHQLIITQFPHHNPISSPSLHHPCRGREPARSTGGPADGGAECGRRGSNLGGPQVLGLRPAGLSAVRRLCRCAANAHVVGAGKTRVDVGESVGGVVIICEALRCW